MEDIKISLINKRGRIIWAEKRDVEKLIEEQGMKPFPSPKEDYYPQYDETGGSVNVSEFNKIGEKEEQLEVELV